MALDAISVRLAFKMIAGTTCPVQPRLVSVASEPAGRTRRFAVQLSAECRAQLFDYLVKRLGFAMPEDGQPMILSEEQAKAVMRLAFETAHLGT